MIVTLTGNLLAERTLHFDRWTPGRTQRARAESFQVGGKGINVSKMLARIQISTTAWCFPGGTDGEACVAWMKEARIPHRAFRSSAQTRTGYVIRGGAEKETTFLAPDRAPSPDALHEAAAAITEQLREDPSSQFALCGSFPGWNDSSADELRAVLADCARRGKLTVDSYGPPLEWALTHPVSLVKINRDEFEPLFKDGDRDLSFAEKLILAATRWPARAWVVTDGARAIGLIEKGGKPALLEPPSVEEVSPTGSGDVLLACVLAAQLLRQMSLPEAVTFALPYAAANAAHPGIAEFDLNNLPLLRSLQP